MQISPNTLHFETGEDGKTIPPVFFIKAALHRFAHVADLGIDRIMVYKIYSVSGKLLSKKGTLSLLGFQNSGIKNPRNFNIDPTGRFCIVANQDADTVQVFRINQETGLLEPTDQVIKIGKPVCVRFVL